MPPVPENDPGRESPSDEASAVRDGMPDVVIPDQEDDDDSDGEDDDDDDEIRAPSGYEPLSQDPSAPNSGQTRLGRIGDDDDEDEDEDREGRRRPAIGHPPSQQVLRMAEEAGAERAREEARERAQVWSSPSSSQKASDSLALDEAKVEAIKSAMAKISLPAASVPAWAAELKDAEWKEAVSKRLSTNIAKKQDK